MPSIHALTESIEQYLYEAFEEEAVPFKKDGKLFYAIYVKKSEQKNIQDRILEENPSWKLRMPRTNETGPIANPIGCIDCGQRVIITVKPERAGDALKPQNFKLDHKKLSYRQYVDLLTEGAHKLQLGETGEFAALLVDHYAKKQQLAALRDYFTNHKIDIDIGAINKDFGECLGPLAVIEEGLFEQVGLKADRNARITFPTSRTEPLLDYMLINGVRVMNISAKAGTGKVNTVKAADLARILSEETSKKYERTPLAKIASIIAEEQGWIAGLLCGPVLKDMHLPDFGKFDPKWVAGLQKSDAGEIIPQEFSAWVRKHWPKSSMWKKGITYVGASQAITSLLSDASKTGPLNFSAYIKDAINKKLVFLKFHIGPQGKPIWNILSAENDLGNKRPYLQGKHYQMANSLTIKKHTDRIGFII